MKNIIFICMQLITTLLIAQVGIDTNDPKATLDVSATPDNSTKLDGIIAPRISGDQLNAKTYTEDQTGAIVYVSQPGVTTGQTIDVNTEGYYYFDGKTTVNKWIKIAPIPEASPEPWRIFGSTSEAVSNIQDIYQNSRVAVGYDYSNAIYMGVPISIAQFHVHTEEGTGVFGSNRDVMFSKAMTNDPTDDMDIDFIHSRGTTATPIAINGSTSTRMGGIRFRGLVSTSGTFVDPLNNESPIFAEINAVTDGNVSSTSAPARIEFRTTPENSISGKKRMIIKNNGNIGIGRQDAFNNNVSIEEPNSTLQLLGTVSMPIKRLSNNQTLNIGLNDNLYTIVSHYNSQNVLNLPNSATIKGRIYHIVYMGNPTASITVNANPSNGSKVFIDGVQTASFVVDKDNPSVFIQALNATTWIAWK